MRAIALSVLFLVSLPLAAQKEPTEEEIKRETALALEQCDADGDGKIKLNELQKKLEVLYVEFATAGKSEEKQQAVRDSYPGLLTLQLFLAADLDDDTTIVEGDLKWLFAHPNDESITLTDTIWTLSDADVDLLVDDFISRMRKGAKSHPHDHMAKKTGKGRKKADRLADRAVPYTRFVSRMVMFKRAAAAIECTYTQEQLSSLFTKLGRRWVLDHTVGGHTHPALTTLGEVVSAERADPERDGNIGALENFPLNYKVLHPSLDKDYRVAVDVTKTTVTVKAGTFECDYLEVRCKDAVSKIWLLSKHPMLPVKEETTQVEEVWTTELVEFDE